MSDILGFVVTLAVISYVLGVVVLTFGAVLTWSTSSDSSFPESRREDRAQAARLLRMAPVWPLVLLRTLLTIAAHKEDKPDV